MPTHGTDEHDDAAAEEIVIIVETVASFIVSPGAAAEYILVWWRNLPTHLRHAGVLPSRTLVPLPLAETGVGSS